MSSPSATPPLTTWQLVKMTGPVILFGILLPFVDNVTDLRMIIRLYWGIPACRHLQNPSDLTRNGIHWEDLYTCGRENPDAFCQSPPASTGCDNSTGTGYDYILRCSPDYVTCLDARACSIYRIFIKFTQKS